MEDRERSGLYAYAGILIGFKIWTLIVILYLTSSWDAVIFVLAGHVLWIAGVAVIIAGPTAFWMRLVRMRRRRRELQYAEWHVDEPLGSVRAESPSED